MDIKNVSQGTTTFNPTLFNGNDFNAVNEDRAANIEPVAVAASQNLEGSFIQNTEGYNPSSNFSSNEISSIKESILTTSVLENNIEVINSELIPMNREIVSALESPGSVQDISRLINEYSSKIETTNDGNRRILNGNYDIPTNNVIKGVRLINENVPLDSERLSSKNSIEEVREGEVRKEQSKTAEQAIDKTTENVEYAEGNSKINWQVQNMKGKDVNFSTFTEDNTRIEQATREKSVEKAKKPTANYNATQQSRQTVLSNADTSNINELRNNFFQHKERLEEASRNYRNSIDAQIKLNEDMFMTKTVIAELDQDKMDSGFSVQYIYSNMSADTLNKIIKG